MGLSVSQTCPASLRCVPRQVPDLYDPRTQWASYLLNAIKAKELFIRDVSYIVRNQEVSTRARGGGGRASASHSRPRIRRCGGRRRGEGDFGSAAAATAPRLHWRSHMTLPPPP